jgi:hypothetical protein
LRFLREIEMDSEILGYIYEFLNNNSLGIDFASFVMLGARGSRRNASQVRFMERLHMRC